jgi:hypothetical protein
MADKNPLENTPVWQILQALPVTALLEIEKCTRSPYFNQREDVALLYKALRKQLPGGIAPSREKAAAEVWPNTPYNSNTFRIALHFLQELVYQYLRIKKVESDQGRSHLDLVQALRGLSLDHLAGEVLAKSESYFEDTQRKDATFQEQQFLYRAELLRLAGGGVRTRKLDLQGLSTQLDKSFILKKLKTAAELLSHQRVFKVEYDFGMLDWLLEHLNQTPELLAAPEINLYYNCCLSLKYPEVDHYFKTLKPSLQTVEDMFPPEECREIVLLALNYCIRRLNAGDEAFAQEGFDLYIAALEKGYLLEKGELDRFTFHNVVAIGIKLGSFDWVDYFIKTYSNKIAPAHRETMSSYCRARLAYSQKNYRDAVSLLQKADYNDLLLHLAAKTILMKIYFETDEHRLLDALLDSMTNFLRRKKIIGYHRENYLNIVKYGRRLSALNRFDRVACDLFKTAITEEPNLTERNWFLQFLGKN